jgi:hypothetical protein
MNAYQQHLASYMRSISGRRRSYKILRALKPQRADLLAMKIRFDLTRQARRRSVLVHPQSHGAIASAAPVPMSSATGWWKKSYEKANVSLA